MVKYSDQFSRYAYPSYSYLYLSLYACVSVYLEVFAFEVGAISCTKILKIENAADTASGSRTDNRVIMPTVSTK